LPADKRSRTGEVLMLLLLLLLLLAAGCGHVAMA
jgi:hypothetical protein